MFQVYGTAQIQSWNYYDSSNKNEIQSLEDGETGVESSENSKDMPHDKSDLKDEHWRINQKLCYHPFTSLLTRYIYAKSEPENSLLKY